MSGSNHQLLRTAIVSTLVGAAVGGLLGAGLAAGSPGYFRALFQDSSAGFSANQVGIGVGVTQGAGAGLALGIVFILLKVLGPWDRTVSPRPWMQRAVFGLVAFVTLSACTGVAYILGGVVNQLRLYELQSADLLKRAAPILESGDYPDVRAGTSSDAQLYFEGTVPTVELRARLQRDVARLFGNPRSTELLDAVVLPNQR